MRERRVLLAEEPSQALGISAISCLHLHLLYSESSQRSARLVVSRYDVFENRCDVYVRKSSKD